MRKLTLHQISLHIGSLIYAEKKVSVRKLITLPGPFQYFSKHVSREEHFKRILIISNWNHTRLV